MVIRTYVPTQSATGTHLVRIDVLPLVLAGLDQPTLADVRGHPLQVFRDLVQAKLLRVLASQLKKALKSVKAVEVRVFGRFATTRHA